MKSSCPARIKAAGSAIFASVMLAACSPDGTEATAEQTAAPASSAPSSSAAVMETNRQTAEAFIDAFYSFDPERLGTFLTEADESAEGILYYQGWAKGGNYVVVNRGACEAESETIVRCPITVQDDPVVALQTGFNVTDTFHLTFSGTDIASIETSSNDQPIYYEAREWVEENMPEVITGPCSNRGTADGTPAECARAMTEGYKAFYAAVYASDAS